jgi:hypothetical protein
MNLLQLRTRLRTRIGSPTVTDVPNATLDEHLNDAYKDICDKYRFRSTRKQCYFPTVAGTDKYTTPTDCLVVMSVRNTTTPCRLVKRNLIWADKQGTKVSGAPTDYVLYRNYIELWSNPDDVYNIQLTYRAEPDTMTDDASEPVIPVSWHEGIHILGRFKYWDSVGDVDRAKYAKVIYNDWVSAKSDEIGEEEFWDQDKGVDVGLSVDRGLDFDHED